MNINPDKVKQLVLIFSRLNEEYQNKLASLRKSDTKKVD